MTTEKAPKTGLFFGSFDPIHTGHLIIAQYFTAFSDLENIWFVITPQNPFKVNNRLLPGEQRLELVELAIGDNTRLSSCDIELRLGTPSYTINTLKKIRELYPTQSFVLIMGSDNLASFDKWKDYQEVLMGYEIYVYPRPGYEAIGLQNRREIKVFDAPYLEISSSFIRGMISTNKSPQYWVPDKVLQKIKASGYYR